MNALNTVNIVGYFQTEEKMKGGASYIEGNDSKKSFYRNKLSVRRAFKNKEDGSYTYDFIPYKAFGHNADYIHKYADEGCQLAITGEIQIDSNYEDAEGNTRYGQPFVLVDSVAIVGGRKSDSSSDAQPAETKTVKKESPFAARFRRMKAATG